MKFVKLDNFWWEYKVSPNNEVTAYNPVGGKRKFDLENKEICEAESWLDLNWENTAIYNNSLEIGWLSPKGKFFGCEYHNHKEQAKFVHNTTEEKLELEGWCKLTYLYGDEDKPTAQFYFKGDNVILPTARQINYLKKTRFYTEEFEDYLMIAKGLIEENENSDLEP